MTESERKRRKCGRCGKRRVVTVPTGLCDPCRVVTTYTRGVVLLGLMTAIVRKRESYVCPRGCGFVADGPGAMEDRTAKWHADFCPRGLEISE